MTLGNLLYLSEPLSNGNCVCLKELLEVLNEKQSVFILAADSGTGTVVIDFGANTLPAPKAHQFPPQLLLPQTSCEPSEAM